MTPLLFATSNAERMRIDSTGNVGIGTTSPDTKLHISKNTTTVGSGKHNILELNIVNYASTTVQNGFGGRIKWGVPRDGGDSHESGYIDCYIYGGAETSGDYYAYDFILRGDETSLML